MPNLMDFTYTKTRAFAGVFFLFLLSSLSMQLWAAPKTDIITFHNGDRLTGEIRSLKRGRLNFNTSATGTIAIEWDKIATIVSNQFIQVETVEGSRYFGQLVKLDEGPGVHVGTEYGPQTLENMQVILMSPIDTGKPREALDINVTFGYNFAKAGGVEQGTFGFDVAYRTQKRIYSTYFSTTINDSNDQEESRRSNFVLNYKRLWPNRWYIGGFLNFDKNDELGLDLRSSLGLGGGRFFIQNNHMLLDLLGGLQISRERLIADPENVDSLEAMLGFNWDWFRFDSPELDWSTTFQAYPNLSDWGRVRADLDTSLKWEIVKDLKWGITFYSTYDNKETGDEESNYDYGINTNVTYELR